MIFPFLLTSDFNPNVCQIPTSASDVPKPTSKISGCVSAAGNLASAKTTGFTALGCFLFKENTWKATAT